MLSAFKKLVLVSAIAWLLPAIAISQPSYCNPLNLDYAYKPSLHQYYGTDESHRSTADAAIVNFKGDLYLFSTNQQGYWWTSDLQRWYFVRKSFKINRSNDDVCAPAAWAWGDTMLFMPSHMDRDHIPLYVSTDPKNGRWTETVDSFPQAHCWDPALFKDDDGRAYLYWGASNSYPLYVTELDPAHGYTPMGAPRELIRLDPDRHGWERFGENNRDTTINPYMEGAWMTKHAGRYYLQYAAPGSEFNVYADGVYTSDHPMGPFTYQKHNPMLLKTGGFITGAGHGSTFQDKDGHWWHVGTIVNWIKHKFERRLAIWPAAFDGDGTLYANTAFGDYPHYLPQGPKESARFTGWMLLSFRKKTWASSTLPQHTPEQAVDENIRTYWSAASAQAGEFLATDLGKTCTIRAVQINYADEDAHVYDKQDTIYHQYRIWKSLDGKNWQVLIDKSKNRTDVPHDYVALNKPARARYLKLENIHMAAGKFAVAGFRIFGNADGAKPTAPQSFQAVRQADDRDADFSWKAVPSAYTYNVHYGIAPDKLYHCLPVQDSTHYHFRGLDQGTPYFAAVEALSEAGVSPRSAVMPVVSGKTPATPTAEVWLTTGDGSKRFVQEASLKFNKGTDLAVPTIRVDTAQRFQTMLGFGASMTGSSAQVLTRNLSESKRREVMEQLFSRERGIGLSYLRMTIGASDFSSHNYSYDDPPGGADDPGLKYFSLAEDLDDVIPRIREAMALNPALELMGSPWSAPAWMKTSGSMVKGKLKPGVEAAFARYLAKYVMAFRNEGVIVSAITLQNEPEFEPPGYPGMLMTAEEQRDFIKNHLGPTFRREGIFTKIVAYDHNWDHPNYPLTILDDPAARQYVDGAAFHCYGGEVANQSQVHQSYPDKNLYFTECSGGGWNGSWQDDLMWKFKNLLIGSLNNWATCVLLWNLALDEKSGPINGGCMDCRGLVTAHTDGTVAYTIDYYALAHFSRFVRKGAQRVFSTDLAAQNLDNAAFINKDGSQVLVVMNNQASSQQVKLATASGQVVLEIPPYSVETVRWR